LGFMREMFVGRVLCLPVEIWERRSSQTSLDSTLVENTLGPQSTVFWIPSVNCNSPANPAFVVSNALKMLESKTYTGMMADLDAGFKGFSTRRFTLTSPFSTISSSRSRTALDPLPPHTRTTHSSQTPHSPLSLVSNGRHSFEMKWLSPAWTMNLSTPTIDFAFNTASPNPSWVGLIHTRQCGPLDHFVEMF